MTTETNIRADLAEVEARAKRLTAELRQVEGQRDGLLLLLTDMEDAHDRRPVAVR